MIDYAAVMIRLHPGREWKLEGDEYEGLVMLDGGNKPTKKTLEDAWPSIKAQIEKEKTDRENARQSALNKLRALGLTDAEIAALAG